MDEPPMPVNAGIFFENPLLLLVLLAAVVPVTLDLMLAEELDTFDVAAAAAAC